MSGMHASPIFENQRCILCELFMMLTKNVHMYIETQRRSFGSKKEFEKLEELLEKLINLVDEKSEQGAI